MRVAFSDFYSGYEQDLALNPVTSYFIQMPSFEIVPIDQKPDLVICSTWGTTHSQYTGPHKIMWTAENLSPGQPWNQPQYTSWDGVGWVISNNHRDAIERLPLQVKHYYVPYAGIHHDMDVVKRYHQKNYNKPKTKFCCFVSTARGNGEGYKLRHAFFNLVNTSYKKVDSGGYSENNIGYYAPRGEAYYDWVSDYKFMICFENSRGSGYLTEKIFTPYAGATIPIYWGDESNFEIIRKEGCLYYTTPEETLSKLILLDQNPTLYESFRRESLLFPESTDTPSILSQNYLHQIYDQIVLQLRVDLEPRLKNGDIL